MDVTVVIPCHGGADLTAACLDSLALLRGGHRLRIVLIDNAGDDDTAALADRPGVEVLRQDHNRGFAGACNIGLATATTELAMVLNNDTQAAPHLLDRLIAALLADDRIGFVAPVSNRVKGPARLDCGDHGATAAGRAEIERELCLPAGDLQQDVDSLSGLCLLGRTATWRALGGFDARFVPGNFEDDDLSLRARLAGLRLVIARGAFLHHEAHRTFAAMGIDMATEIRRQHAVFAAKWRDHPAGRAVLATLAGDHGAAAAHAAAARRRCPQWPDADWLIGQELADRGHAGAAVPHLLALLRHCPAHPDALLRLGACWLDLDQPERARDLWRAALDRCWFAPRQGAALLLRLADHARARGDLDAARLDLEAAVQVCPEDANLWNTLGAMLIELRRFDDALPALERAAEAGAALAHTNLGICHFHRGDNARALEHFARAAAQLPDDPTAQTNYQRALAAGKG